MKVLLLINSFKGTASSLDINLKLLKALSEKFYVKYFAVSDGGDGFLDCFRKNSKNYFLTTEGPFINMKVKTEYLISKKGEAFIEIANICGIKYLKKEQLNPIKATTYGLGKVVFDAIKNGAKDIYFGLGGTASNDCGCGLAHSLGIKFIDENKNEVFPDIDGIIKTKYIDFSEIRIKKGINFFAICDVKNKLLGKYGSARIFGTQKGATKKDIEKIEQALKHLTKLIKKQRGVDISKIEGGASAGGLASGLYGFFDAKIINGARFVIERLDLETHIKNSDIIITGEGKFDKTSFYGKITGEIIKIAQKYKKKVLVITAVSEIKTKKLEIIDLSKRYPIKNIIKEPIFFITKEIKNYLNK